MTKRAAGQPRAGFTLVELLVVIGVIAILMGLLLPALGRAKESGYMTVCRNNLHQWGIGLRMYVNDSDAYPTGILTSDGEVGDGLTWYKRLEPYTGATWPRWDSASRQYQPGHGVAVCPSYARLPNPLYGLRNPGYDAGSYAYHTAPGFALTKWEVAEMVGPYMLWGRADTATVRESEVVNPSEMIAIGDSPLGIDLGWPAIVDAPPADPGPPSGTAGMDEFGPASKWSGNMTYEIPGLRPYPSNCPNIDKGIALTKRRHWERFNILFCDGHVENLRPESLWDLRRDDVLRRWNRDHQPHREWVDFLPH